MKEVGEQGGGLDRWRGGAYREREQVEMNRSLSVIYYNSALWHRKLKRKCENR